MRVGIDVSPLEGAQPTGVERVLIGNLRALAGAAAGAREGWEFLLLSPRPVRFAFELPGHMRAVVTGGAGVAGWRERRLRRVLDREAVELFHSPVTAIPVRGAFRKIATVHEVSWIRARGIEGGLHRFRHRWRLAVAARRAFRIVTPSEATREDVLRAFPRAEPLVRVIPPGIDDYFFETGSPDADAAALARLGLGDGPYVLMVGGGVRHRKKNLHMAIRVHAALVEKLGRVVPLVIAGPRDRIPEVRGAGVVATGYVDQADLRALYRRARVLLYPSVTEGFGFPPLEAMACGVPVLASTGGAIPEVAGDGALLHHPGDAHGLASKLHSLFTDDDLRARMIEQGRRRAESFRHSNLAANLLDLYRGS